MKKFLRIAAALMAVFAMTNFIACSSDSSDDDDSKEVTTPGGNTGNENGNTGNENGGSNDETGNSYANTYWGCDYDYEKKDDGYTITYSAVKYVNIKDATSGELYEASDEEIEKAVDELLEAGVSGGVKNVSYNSPTSFTYVIEGSKIVITINNDTVINADFADDKKSFSYTENGDTYTLKKLTDAPESIKVTYTVKNTEDPTPAETVTANVYNLVTLTDEDYVTLGSVIDGAAQQYSDSKGNLKNALKIKALSPAVTLSSGLIVYNSSDNQILVRTTSETDLTPAGAINYGGQSVGDKTNNGTVPVNAGDAVTLSDVVKVSRYLAIPVEGGDAASQFKVTVKYKPTNEKGIQIVLVDQNNVMLAKDDVNTSKTEKTFVTPAITKGEVTEVRVYLFRTGDATSGGADVSEISIAPVTGE